MYDRLLFLDIDGVVNTVMIWDSPENLSKSTVYKDGYYFELCHPGDNKVSNKQAMLWVSKLCTDYDLSVIITSTWLIGNDYKKIAEALYNSGLSREVQVLGGINKNYGHSRGWQIEAWFNDTKLNPDQTTMVILDDDSDMVGYTKDFSKYLIQCSNTNGFTHIEYIKASKLLDEQFDNGE
jgi:hypothetical protein